MKEVPVQDKTRKQECQANVKEGEKNCQVNMWSRKPAMQSSSKKQHVPLCSDKNCQSTRCYWKKSPVRPMYGNDKNCQDTKFMWPVQPTKKRSCYMQSMLRPAKLQSARCCKKKNQVKSVCSDKNCQFTQ